MHWHNQEIFFSFTLKTQEWWFPFSHIKMNKYICWISLFMAKNMRYFVWKCNPVSRTIFFTQLVWRTNSSLYIFFCCGSKRHEQKKKRRRRRKWTANGTTNKKWQCKERPKNLHSLKGRKETEIHGARAVWKKKKNAKCARIQFHRGLTRQRTVYFNFP